MRIFMSFHTGTIKTVLLPIRYITNKYILPNWLSPNCTITEHSYPRIVSLPIGTITELGITELFYYGLFEPNVTHSLLVSSSNRYEGLEIKINELW